VPLWVMRPGDTAATMYTGDAAGLAAAKAYIAASPPGVMQIGPGHDTLPYAASWSDIALVQTLLAGSHLFTRVRIGDATDPTKRLFFDPSGIATGTERTATAHDWSGDLLLPAGLGSSGQFLKSNGAAAQPSWAAISASGLDHSALLHLKPFQVVGNVTINNTSTILTDAAAGSRFANVRIGDRINLDDANYVSSLYGFVATTSGATDPNNITMSRSNTSGGNITGATATVFPGSEHFDSTLLEGLLSTSGWGTFDGGAPGTGTVAVVRGSWQFRGYASGATPVIDFIGSSSIATPWGFCVSKSGTTFKGFFYANDLTATRSFKLPDIDGFTIVVTDGAQTIRTKILDSGNRFRMEPTAGAGSGCAFTDTSDTTKTLRYDLTGIGTGTNRIVSYPNVDGQAVIRDGTVDLTAQTANLGPTNIVAAVPAGVYRVSVYHFCSTAGAAGTLATTIGWSDGTARTKKPAADIQLTSTANFDQGTLVLRAAAVTNITYQTVITGGSGTPKYDLYIRVEAI